MSHFTVAVFHRKDQSVEELLAPYSEDVRVPKRIDLTKEEAIEFARRHYGGFADKTDEECWDAVAADYEDDMKDEEGNLYTTYNPNSKWDWYSIGGRWGGELRLKTGESCDEGRVGDLDFSDDEDEYEEGLRFWDACVEGKTFPGSEEYSSFYKKEYYFEYYGTREAYAKSLAEFSTFAVVTPDGTWHEKGRMGWFACSSETPAEAKEWLATYKEKFIDAADPDWILTLVDCHI